jgi:hypothetical protein
MSLRDYYRSSDCAIPKGKTTEELRAERRTVIEKDLKAKKAAVRSRDRAACAPRRCRWPEADHDTEGHRCEGMSGVAHRIAVGMGGDQTETGERSDTADMMEVCGHIHLDSVDAIERHGRTWIGSANGAVTFIRRGEVVGVEKRIGVLRS